MPASIALHVRRPSRNLAAMIALSPCRAKKSSARARWSGRVRKRWPNRSTNGRPPRYPSRYPMSAPAVAPTKPKRMTTSTEWWRAAAHAPATRRSGSPGNGMPALSMRMPRPANGYPSTSTMPAQFTRVHILDDPMSDYGEHEPTEDPLQQLRHSTAHLLAAAVTELYPEAKYGIGPPVQDGFYYDFDFGGKSISEADLAAIESRMRKLAQADIPFVHEVLSREKAVDEFRRRGQDYKLELIADKVEGDEGRGDRTGDFPH